MQRWFYATEEIICDHPILTPEPSVTESETSSPRFRYCRFCVRVCDRELLPNEAVAVIGDCEQLGCWKFENCVLMSPIMDDCQDKWHVYIDIPANKVVSYRYLIVAIDPEGDQMIVRFFESHLKPRKVQPQSECIADACEDEFGVVKDCVKVERGWVTTERIVQLMFFKAPFQWCEEKFKDYVMKVKVTPAHRRKIDYCAEPEGYVAKPINIETELKDDEVKGIPKREIENPFKCKNMVPSYTKLHLVDCKEMFPKPQSQDDETNTAAGNNVPKNIPATKPNVELSTAFAFNEVVNFSHKKDILKRQPIFGTPCDKTDLILFHLTIGDFDNTVYLIELFAYSKHAAPDENPYLVGYRYLSPEDLQSASSGYIEAPIVCASKHRMIGKMHFRFLVIRPAEDLKFDLSVSYLRSWSRKQKTLDTGHRGQGRTYQTEEGNFVYENTIQSIQMAVDNGADMVEFDVHLSKDAVPVIYHDFNVHVSQTNQKVLQRYKSIKIPLNKLTLKELRNLRLPKNVKLQPPKASDAGVGDVAKLQQLFPLFSDVMDACDEDILYDVEIKWPQQFCNGKWEEGVKPRFDRNLYIDHILKVIVAKARNRRLVLSTFDADMCSILRFKQNLYPVMFLLPDAGVKPYLDARSNTFSAAINFAYGMELLGIIPHANAVITNPKTIGEYLELRLVVFCYGVVGGEDTSALKDMGVSAIILDRMDKLSKQDECICPECPPSDFDDKAGGGDSSSIKSIDSWE